MSEIKIKFMPVGIMPTNCYIIHQRMNEAIVIDPVLKQIKSTIILLPMALLARGFYNPWTF